MQPVGAILEQDFGNGLQPVAFASRKLNGAEMRYSAYERDLLGIVWALAQWKHYCRGPHSVIIQTNHAPLRHLPNQASVNTHVWKWIIVMQGYNLEIRHIPGKRNPADTLSRQDKKDALGRKTAVHDATADLVRELRVPSDAGDEAIQDALKKLFNQVQAQSSQTQSSSVSSTQQTESVSEIKASGPDQVQASSSVQFRDQISVQQPVSEFSSHRTTQCTVTIARSSITIDQTMREKMYSLLTKEILYSDIIEEMERQE